MTPRDGVDVFCLCAAWCRLCEAYAAVFARVGAELAVAHPGLRFAGAIAPQEDTLRRVLRACVEDRGGETACTPAQTWGTEAAAAARSLRDRG